MTLQKIILGKPSNKVKEWIKNHSSPTPPVPPTPTPTEYNDIVMIDVAEGGPEKIVCVNELYYY